MSVQTAVLWGYTFHSRISCYTLESCCRQQAAQDITDYFYPFLPVTPSTSPTCTTFSLTASFHPYFPSLHLFLFFVTSSIPLAFYLCLLLTHTQPSRQTLPPSKFSYLHTGNIKIPGLLTSPKPTTKNIPSLTTWAGPSSPSKTAWALPDPYRDQQNC